MSRIEFMNELRSLLQGLSVEEREEALQYYNDYFDDAGLENEASVIKELGSPAKLAETIKAGLGGQNDNSSEYTETGYKDTRYENNQSPAQRYTSTEDAGKQPWTNTWVKIGLIALIIIIGVPVVVPAAGGILAGIFGILIAIVAVLAAIVFSGIALVIAGIVVFCVGIAQLFHSIPLALGMIGGSLLMIAIGAAITVFIAWAGIKIVPPMFRGVVNLCKKPFQNKKGGQS